MSTAERDAAADKFADEMKVLNEALARIERRRPLSEMMLALACAYCGVGPEVECHTKSGRRCQMHSARWYDALPGWQAQS